MVAKKTVRKAVAKIPHVAAISVYGPYEIDKTYEFMVVFFLSMITLYICQPPVVGPLHDVWRKHRCTPVLVQTSLHRATQRFVVTVVTWLFHLRLPEFCLKSDVWWQIPRLLSLSVNLTVCSNLSVFLFSSHKHDPAWKTQPHMPTASQ